MKSMSLISWKELDSEKILQKLEETNKLDDEIFEYLSKHDDYEVRITIAKRFDAPEKILTKLSKDNDLDVVEQVAKNHNTSDETIEYLKQEHEWLLDTIIFRKLPTDWRMLGENEIIDKLSSERLTNEVLEILINVESIDIKKAIAENKSTSIEILKKLSQDEYVEHFLKGIVENPNTSVELKENLLKGDLKEYYELITETSAPDEIKLNFDEKILKEIKLFFDRESKGEGGDVIESASWEINHNEYGVTEEVSSKSIIIWAMARLEDEYKIKIEFRYYNENSDIITDVSIGSYDMKIGVDKKNLIQLDIALGQYIDNGGILSDLHAN